MESDAVRRVEEFFAEFDEYADVGCGCNTCGGGGWIVICPDDLCRGAGECMHGDGEAACPDCDVW